MAGGNRTGRGPVAALNEETTGGTLPPYHRFLFDTDTKPIKEPTDEQRNQQGCSG